MIPSILVISLTTCIDPYILDLENYESNLVIEGLITDELVANTIRLSRTFQDEETLPVMVSKAEVSVRDEYGEITVFKEQETGIYKSDSMQFTGRVGGTYTLHIKTDDGLEFESDPCTMTAVPPIDSIYYAADSEFFNNGREEEKGLRIFLDASNKEEVCQYFRWEFEEVWKYLIPYPVEYKYLGDCQFEYTPPENYFCWKYSQSKEVLIHSTEEQNRARISREAIEFIASGKSKKLRTQYSILVKQYSLSQREYTFWKNHKEVTESGGDIFERQPFSVMGNIHSTKREKERILGYFQVSAVKKMRKYITFRQIYKLDIPFYRCPCTSIKIKPGEVMGPKPPSMSLGDYWDECYWRYFRLGYVFTGPFYDELGKIVGFEFTTPECSVCSPSGGSGRPDFWVDMY